MVWVALMFQFIGAVVIAFIIGFSIFLVVHGNPMRKLAHWTHGHVSDIKKVVVDIHKSMNK